MAKKDLGDFPWDSSLDYEFEDPFAPTSNKKKRGVVTRVATNFAAGVKDAFTSPAVMKAVASNLLPKGYGTALNLAEDVYREGDELHNIALQELKPSIPAMKRITQRNLPAVKKYLPKGVSEKLEEFSKPETGGRAPTKEEVDDNEIRKSLGEVFGVEMEAAAHQSAVEKIERQMNHMQSMKMSRTQLHTLNIMQQGMMRLVNYQDDVTSRFQRRSLELQTRHYFLARDAYRLQTATASRVNSSLEALVTNTAMPDIAKQDLRHTAKQTFRTRMLGSLQDTAGRYAKSYLGNIAKKAHSVVREASGNVNDTLEYGEGMEDMPLLDSLFRMAGTGAVKGASTLAADPAQKWLKKHHPGVHKFGAKLHRSVTNAPQSLNKWARSSTSREGFTGAAEDGLKDIFKLPEMDMRIGLSGVDNLDRPATFDKLTRRSIIEIIPGFLSRIHHEVARINDPTATRQVYNHDKNAFTDMRTASDDMANRAFGKETRASLKQNVNTFIDELVGKQPISDQTRSKLLRQILMDSGNQLPFDKDRYVSPASTTPELDATAKSELGEIFKHTGKSEDGTEDEEWLSDRSDNFRSIDFGARAPVSAAGVYRSLGQRELLDDQNLVTREGSKDNLNLSKILDMVEAGSYDDIKVKKQTAAGRLSDQLEKKMRGTIDGIHDLFIKGGLKAVLEAGKLKTGAYRDDVTGAIITKWEDIQGPVRDMTTNTIVVDASVLSRGLIDSKGKTYSFSIRSVVGGASDWVAATLDTVRTQGAARKEQLSDILNAKGEVLLTDAKLKAGQYRDAVTKQAIKSVEDIVGPVIDENGDTVVSASDIAGILRDKAGRKFTGLAEKVRRRTEQLLNQADQAPPPAAHEQTASGTASASAFGHAANTPNDFEGVGAGTEDGELVRLNTEQVELLKTIASILAAQGPNGGTGEGGDRVRRGFLDSIVVAGAKGAWKAAKVTGSGTWWWAKKSVGLMGKGIGLGTGSVGALATGTTHRIGNLVRGFKDIYVTGKRKPALVVDKIRAGHYRDTKTNKRVKRYTDVTGPVIDITTGETVVDQADYDKGLFVKRRSGLVRLGKKAISGLGGAVLSFYGNAAALPFKAATALTRGIVHGLKWAVNKQVDVYVKGEKTPRLMATKMKTGRYYNTNPKKVGKQVTNYSDIYGEIKELAPGSHKAQADDKTVLYENEITDPGICGRWGTSLKTPALRLLSVAVGAIGGVVKGAASLFGGAIKGYGKLFGGMMGLGGGLIGAPFKFLGALLNPFEKHGAKQVEWLEKIFTVLDKRLPGEKLRKGSWQEQKKERESEEKETQSDENQAKASGKWGLGSALGWLKAKSGFGSKDPEDADGADEDGGGGNTIIAGGGGGKAAKITKAARHKRALKKLKMAKRRKGMLGGLFRAKDKLGGKLGVGKGIAGKVLKKVPGISKLSKLKFGSKAKIATSIVAALGGDYVLDKLTGGNRKVNKAVNTGAEVAGDASTAWWVKKKVAQLGARILPGMGGAGAEAAAGTVAAEGAAAAAGTVAAEGAAAAAGTVAAEATLGTAAAVIGAPVWIPLAIAAAVIGAAGVGIYYAHKQMKYGKLSPVRRFRYLQYGIASGDAANNKKIFQLEDLLLDHIGVVKGGLEVVSKSTSNGKAISMKTVYELMGLDDGWFSNKSHDRLSFNVWYARRFKPIFLTWVKNLRSLDPKMSLLESDEKLPAEKQVQLVKQAWTISRELYGLQAGPFGETASITDVSLIEDAYSLALKQAGKSPKEKSKEGFKNKIKTAAKWMTGGFGALLWSRLENKYDEKEAVKEGAELTAKSIEAKSGMAMIATKGAIKNTKGVDSALTSSLSRLGKVSALTAIRYRAYGLSDLDTDRVRALAALETYITQHLSFASDGQPYFLQDAEQAYMEASGTFGLLPNAPGDRARWAGWFGHRFLPTFLAYAKAVHALAPNASLQTPEQTLKADKLMEIGQQILSAKDVDGRSVWFWTSSPWSAQERLNADSNAVSGSLLALKNSADKKVSVEEKLSGQDAAVKKNKGTLSTMMDKMKSGAKSASDWLLGDKDHRNVAGKVRDSVAQAASSVWTGAKSGLTSAVHAMRTAATGTAKLVNGAHWPNLNTDALWKKVAPLIAAGESMGGKYDAQNGVSGSQTPGLTGMTFGEVYALSKQIGASDGKGPKTGAAGKYQFIPTSLIETMPWAGLKMTDPFSPDNQERLARARFDWRIKMSHEGGPTAILDSLSQEWASLPSPSKGGQSWYHGDSAGNRSLGGQARLKELFAAVSGSLIPAANAAEVTPTTTTANGPTGGVGPVQKTQAPMSTPTVTASIPETGVKASVTRSAPVASAPSINATASLDVAAANVSAQESARVKVAERERKAREQTVRATEAQSQNQSQTDQAQMSRVGELLKQSLDVQRQIAVNTADTVSVLRDFLRRNSGSGQAGNDTASTAPARPAVNPPKSRPTQHQPDRVPVSMRFGSQNG